MMPILKKSDDVRSGRPRLVTAGTGVNGLRKNPPKVQVTTGQNLCTQIIYIMLQTSVQQVDCFFRDAQNSCPWRERTMFWVM